LTKNTNKTDIQCIRLQEQTRFGFQK